MAHIPFVVEEYSYAPFNKAARQRNKFQTPVLGTWCVEAMYLDQACYDASNDHLNYGAAQSYTGLYEAWSKIFDEIELINNKEVKEIAFEAAERQLGKFHGFQTMPVWGTLYSPLKHLGISEDTYDLSQEEREKIIAFNEHHANAMRKIGINAVAIADDDINKEKGKHFQRCIIFVPDTRVVETPEYSGSPLSFKTDLKSRALMLIYLEENDLIDKNSPEIKDAFPLTVRNKNKNLSFE